VYVGYLPEESLTWTLSYTLWASWQVNPITEARSSPGQ
jgi:hypothetical protein